MGSGESAQVVAIVLAAVTGLMVGSFLNVVIYRMPQHLSIVRPPSHCPSCGAQLGPIDTVPVLSWLALRGRCRHCGTHISGRYPLVELSVGGAFAALAAALGSVAPLPSLAFVTAFAFAASVIDADGSPVPRSVAFLCGIGALSLVPVTVAVGHPGRLGWAAIGGLLVAIASVAADRTQGAGRWHRMVVLASLGWCASWLWPGGGPLTAAWIVAAAAATIAGRTRRVPLPVLAVGGWAMVIAGAALIRP